MMSGDYELQEFLEQLDDRSEFNPVDDAGLGFDAYNAGGGDHCTYTPMQYYGEDPNIEEYSGKGSYVVVVHSETDSAQNK